jgi:hypothetical protein
MSDVVIEEGAMEAVLRSHHTAEQAIKDVGGPPGGDFGKAGDQVLSIVTGLLSRASDVLEVNGQVADRVEANRHMMWMTDAGQAGVIDRLAKRLP